MRVRFKCDVLYFEIKPNYYIEPPNYISKPNKVTIWIDEAMHHLHSLDAGGACEEVEDEAC